MWFEACPTHLHGNHHILQRFARISTAILFDQQVSLVLQGNSMLPGVPSGSCAKKPIATKVRKRKLMGRNTSIDCAFCPNLQLSDNSCFFGVSRLHFAPLTTSAATCFTCIVCFQWMRERECSSPKATQVSSESESNRISHSFSDWLLSRSACRGDNSPYVSKLAGSPLGRRRHSLCRTADVASMSRATQTTDTGFD